MIEDTYSCSTPRRSCIYGEDCFFTFIAQKEEAQDNSILYGIQEGELKSFYLLTLLLYLPLTFLQIIIRHTLDITLHSPRVHRRLQFHDSRIPREVPLLSGQIPD